MNKLRIIHITPLIDGQEKEFADDLRRLHRECGVTDVAFLMPLMPEEACPTMAKVEWLTGRFQKMRERLADSGLKMGILIQNTLGHGTFSASLFNRTVNEKGTITSSLCPLAPGLKEYLHDVVAIAAAARPEFMLVDDDFRLSNLGAPGCYCEHHLAALAKVAGHRFEREALVNAMAKDPVLRKQWDDVRLESLLLLARAIRAAIDATDPKIPCGQCICDCGGIEIHWAHAIGKTLAGNNPPLIRLSTAWYWDGNPLSLLYRIYWVSAQAQALRDIPERLGESDTYPQNRHYSSSKMLQAQIVFSLLHGCTGLKLWVSRCHDFQPRSGEAYRVMLRENLPLFQELRQLMPNVTWEGSVTPLAAEMSAWPSSANSIRWLNWAQILCRLGFPMRVKGNPQKEIVMLTGPECDQFSDAEITRFLSYGLLLDGAAAEKLVQRGFGELLGVTTVPRPGWTCSLERFNDDPLNGTAAGKLIKIASLDCGAAVPLATDQPQTRVLSRLYWIPFYGSCDEKEVGTGVTLYENRLGGRVAVYAAVLGETPFLDENRQTQLHGVFSWLNRAPLPLAADSDLDIYVMHGQIAPEAGGGELAAFFVLSPDSLPELRLRCGGNAPTDIAALDRDGQWKALPFELGEGDETIVKTGLESVRPLVLRIRR